MDINTLSQLQTESQYIVTDSQAEPKRVLESQWVFLGGERMCRWVMVEQ